MPEQPKVEWRKGPDFAQVAEALGVTTGQILMAQAAQGGVVSAYYTLTPAEDDTLMHQVSLKRGQDGILIQASQPVPLPGLWEKILASAEEEIEQRLREKLGPPPDELAG
jgi:hypothetical protein